MPFVITQNALPEIITGETVALGILIDLYPSETSSQYREFDERLTIAETPTGLINGVNDTYTFTHEPAVVYRNGTDETDLGTIDGNTFVFDTPPSVADVITGRVIIPFRTYSFEENETDLAGTLQCELAQHSDRNVLTRDVPIRFETGEKISGVWQWETLLDTAMLRQSDYRLANQNDIPSDSFAVTFTSLLQSRLDTTPLGTVVLYDPAKLTVNDQDLMSIPDIDGVDNPVTTVPTTALSVHKIFDYAATACGFTGGVKTNIPDYPVRRIDFNAGAPYFSPISGLIGMFEPYYDYDAADDAIVIREGTADFLPDTTAARVLTCDDMVSLGISNTIDRFKGCLVTYQLQGTGWDYWLETVDHFLNPPGGIGTLVTQTEVVTRKYFRKSFPNTPVNQNKSRQTQTITVNTFTTFKRINETFTYDGMGNLLQRTRSADSRLPVQSQWPIVIGEGYIANGEGPVFATAASPVWEYRLQKAESELETLVYLAYPYEADSVYIAYREINKTGIIIVDGENQQLGEDYSNSLLRAAEQGQVETYQTGRWGDISNFREWQIPQQNRQVTLITQITDTMNTDAGLTAEPVNQPDVRVGDIGIPAHKQITKQVYVNDGGDATATRVKPLNGGEAPLSVLKPLATRINRRQFAGGKAGFPVPGVDLSLTKGRAVSPEDRAGTSFGTFRILGRRIDGADGKRTTTLTTQQLAIAE